MADGFAPDTEMPRRSVTKRLRHGLTAISTHGALSDNELSMIWTARVALNGNDTIDLAPEHLREMLRERFADYA